MSDLRKGDDIARSDAKDGKTRNLEQLTPRQKQDYLREQQVIKQQQSSKK
jgi:hypothetical protein